MLNAIRKIIKRSIKAAAPTSQDLSSSFAHVTIPDDLRNDAMLTLRDADASTYLLRMFWQGRLGKIDPYKLPVLDWMTRSFLPADIVLASYTNPAMTKIATFDGLDHRELADQVIAGLTTWACTPRHQF